MVCKRLQENGQNFVSADFVHMLGQDRNHVGEDVQGVDLKVD